MQNLVAHWHVVPIGALFARDQLNLGRANVTKSVMIWLGAHRADQLKMKLDLHRSSFQNRNRYGSDKVQDST